MKVIRRLIILFLVGILALIIACVLCRGCSFSRTETISTVTPRVTPSNTPWKIETPSRGKAPTDEHVWYCPTSTEGARYIASVESDVFHSLTCEHIFKIKRENRICFSNREVAFSYGYVPCKECKP